MWQLIKRQALAYRNNYEEIPSLAWWLMFGSGISNLLSFACLPFLAIILSKQGTNPLLIGIVLGAAPLISIVVGFLCSSLSDYLGRRVIILIALYLWSISFFLFAVASLTSMYILVSALLGLSQALFEPTSQALLSDLVPKEKVQKIFKLRYLILNIGFAFGPMLGATLAIVNEKFSFILAFLFFAAYSLAITVKTRHLEFKNKEINKGQPFIKITLSILTADKALLNFLMAGICVAITYSQFESTLPQYIFSHGLNNFFYAGLLMVNAFGVLIFQIPISKIADKFTLISGMKGGGILLFLGYLILAISNGNFAIMFLGMLVITFGELFISPVQNVIVNRLATPKTYGLYFGAYNLRQLGFALGPIMGGYLFGVAGGTICFLSIALFGIIATYFFSIVQNQLVATNNDNKLTMKLEER